MFGDKAAELMRELERSADNLIPYNVSPNLILNIFRFYLAMIYVYDFRKMLSDRY